MPEQEPTVAPPALDALAAPADAAEEGAEITLPRQYIRILYAKTEAIKFISHHDEFRLWERTLRRADLPLLYKQGFNPQPHMQFASPLGVGITGARELLDITLSPPVPLPELRERLAAKLAPGVHLVSVSELDKKPPSVQGLLIGSDYTILIYAAPGEIAGEEIEERIAGFLAQQTIWRERERKGEAYTYNLRPLIFALHYVGYDPAAEEHRIFLRVQQRAGATGRPDEVVDALGMDDYARTLRRDRIYFADAEEDVAVFAVYPLITQQQIAGKKGAGRSLRAEYKAATRKSPTIAPGGVGMRSINERASDEFA
jgi:radical SAM-linked protein